MKRKNVHVVPSGNNWVVKVEGQSKPVSTHRTQSAAIKAGKPVAVKNGSEEVIHRPNGQIRDSNSYGNDPCPPKG